MLKERVEVEPKGDFSQRSFSTRRIFGTFEITGITIFKVKIFHSLSSLKTRLFKKGTLVFFCQRLTFELKLAVVHASEAFWSDDRLFRAVLDCVRLVSVFTADQKTALHRFCRKHSAKKEEKISV